MVNPQAPSAGGNAASSTRPSGIENLKEDASSLVDDAKSEAKDKVEDLRGVAADKVDTLADGIRAAASEFEGNDIGHMSDYVTELADSLGRLSSSMRDKTGDDLLKEVTRLARDNPALFVTGSIAVGFGLSRFAKASASSPAGRSSGARASAGVAGNTESSGPVASRAESASTPAGTSGASGDRPGVAYGTQPASRPGDAGNQAAPPHTGPRP